MDPQVWEEPERFLPERYEAHVLLAPEYVAAGDWTKRDHFGYGAGRRICPGMYLAERNMLLSVAKLLWAFRFEAAIAADGTSVPVDADPVTGYHSGFLYCPKEYACTPVLRSERIRETVAREYEGARRDIFNRFEGS